MVGLEFFLHLFSRDRDLIIFDVGAHHGDSVETFIALYPNSTVFAFEPDKENFGRLCSRVSDASNVQLFNVAVGQSDGRVLLHRNNYNATHSLLPFNGDEINRWADANDFQETGIVEVDQVGLDSFCACNNIAAIDILKMDTQGGELMALQGAQVKLAEQAIGAVFCEVEFRRLYEGQPLFWDITAYLMARDYHFINIVGPKVSAMGVLSWADAIYVNDQLWRRIAARHSGGKVV